MLQAQSTTYGDDVKNVRGSTTPRLWTPPLVELTPETSFGFDVVEFADTVIRRPLDPWQEWLVIHGGELRPDGRPRFRKIIVLVSRQNGKTEVLVVLSLFWQFVVSVPLILGTSTKLDYAQESWEKGVQIVENCPHLDHLHAPGRKNWTRRANGEQVSWTLDRPPSRYKIAASNEEGGRSLTVDRLVLDELRQHHTYGAWDASYNAGRAIQNFQVWGLSNAGDDRSIVLNDLREDALAYIDTGEGDDELGLFEWSAEDDADPLDVRALAQANPNLGRRIPTVSLLNDAARAVAKGGEHLTGFRTENMCIRVRLLTPAIDPGAWLRSHVAGDLSKVRSRVAVCLDVSPDQQHATLAAAAQLADGRTRGEIVQAWDGVGCTERLRRDLPGLLARIKPKVLGWFPSGPAASLAAALKPEQVKNPAAWTSNAMPKVMRVEEIRSEVAAVCMGFEDQVVTGQFVHNDDPLLNAHVAAAERVKRADTWVFAHRGEGHADAVYAMAGAVHLARTLPKSAGKARVIGPSNP
jgi:phage terminase large subunit-like protein